jgi:hypothetical protein
MCVINISQSSPIEDADESLKPSYVASLKLSSTKVELVSVTKVAAPAAGKLPLPAPDHDPGTLSI